MPLQGPVAAQTRQARAVSPPGPEQPPAVSRTAARPALEQKAWAQLAEPLESELESELPPVLGLDPVQIPEPESGPVHALAQEWARAQA
nr:hypothetical protein [Pseudomonas sp.]